MNFIAACSCAPNHQIGNQIYGDYNYEFFFTFLLSSTLIICLLSVAIALSGKVLIIEEGQIIYKSPFSSLKKTYKLTDIIDFKWDNKPKIQRTGGRIQTTTKAKNENIYIFFKNNEILELNFKQYKNFDVIKKYLFSYCVKHNIITVRPLEDRKRSTFQLRNILKKSVTKKLD